jgi:hypothetical protein
VTVRVRYRLAGAAMMIWASAASLALAAGMSPAASADLRRAVAMVGASTSEEAALREARKTREPSAPFLLGAALGAWINAAAQLDYDLRTPSGDGDDSGAIAIDCFDERTAFDHLEARRQALKLDVVEVLAGADITIGDPMATWKARQHGPSPRCR